MKSEFSLFPITTSSNKLSNSDNIGVLRTFFTRYGETVIMVGIPVSSLKGESYAGSSISLMADLYTHLRRSGRRADISSTTSLNGLEFLIN